MLKLFKNKFNLAFIVNPFFLYCFAFSFAVFLYLWGWSDLFPALSAELIIYFVSSFLLFILAGYFLQKKVNIFLRYNSSYSFFINDIIFWLIIILGFLDVILMGYLPILDRSNDYRQFGIPVIDVLFNTLSIFFSVWFFQSFLENRKRRYLIYFLIILVIQIPLFRRSTIVWILVSSSFLFLIYNRKIILLIILAGIICIPLLSYCFGLYGNTRSNLIKSFVLNDLGASETFKNLGISHNHYMTYLYIASPLANLQKNIDNGDGFFNKREYENFFFYSLLPESFTMRLEKPLHLSPPVCSLITPELIAGSFLMVSFHTIGWGGMISMVVFLFAFILLCLAIIRRWTIFSVTTFCILSTAVSLLIFANFLNRLDVILMLFIYPVLFHLIYTGSNRVPSSVLKKSED
ncbi:MAG: hypothetical protein LLG13_01185 [Bacteroidales bacterium]|nr:hypothetical protein [Bacteroidales bacterium]